MPQCPLRTDVGNTLATESCGRGSVLAREETVGGEGRPGQLSSLIGCMAMHTERVGRRRNGVATDH